MSITILRLWKNETLDTKTNILTMNWKEYQTYEVDEATQKWADEYMDIMEKWEK